MLPTSSSRKPLLRSNSERGDRPGMRNWPLFGFLFALVFFFYIVYIYQAQSAELEALRDQFDSQVQLAKTVKRELIDVKAEVEKLRSHASGLVSERDTAKSQGTECANNLRTCTLKVEQFTAEKTRSEDSIKEKDSQIENLQKSASEVANLRSLLTAQETISEQLNKTVAVLQDELNVLKTAKLQVAPVVTAGQSAQEVAKQPEAAPAADSKVTEAKADTVAAVTSSETTTTPPMEAPKLQDSVVEAPQADPQAPKVQPIESEGKEEPKMALDDQMDAPAKNGPPPEDDDDKAEVKVKEGNYDDKPDI